MSRLSKYDLIAVAYRARILFRTDAEYREALGVSFETVVNNRESKREIAVYYDRLSRECEERVEKSLREIAGDYVAASELYRTLDWGARTQMASRRRFCRMLFRLYATAGMELSVDEIFKFKVRDDDRRLLETFFPEGAGGEPAVELGYILLFTFGVIRPWSGVSGARSRDLRDKESVEALGRLRRLIEAMCEDMPRLGSTEKPLVFDEWLTTIDDYLSHQEDSLAEITPLRLLSAMLDIFSACRSLATTQERRTAAEQLQGYDMPGIWIDDADGGESRFWVFPDNLLVAFCYRRAEGGWEMYPYELRVRFATDSSYTDGFLMLAPEGNLAYTLAPDSVLDREQFGSGACDCEFDEATGDMCRVELYEKPCKFPEWLNWRSWERLKRDERKYREFRDVIRSVYDPANPQSLFFRNVAPELTDVVNNLVGRDNMYLYVYDWCPKRFALCERRPDRFTYEGIGGADLTQKGLFELPISEEHPLYALPSRVNEMTPGNKEAALLADLLKDSANIPTLYIIHSERITHPRLSFPDYGRSIKLDMELLAEIGVKKFTDGSPFVHFS